MIVTRTPYRISLFGGGSDYPSWNKISGRKGSVIGFAIDKYSYISLRYLPPFFPNKYRIAYSRVETANHYSNIEHPAVKNIIKAMKIHDGLEVHHHGDLPARTGIGSSSSFSVGLINGICALQGKTILKKELAKTAIHIEQNIIKENVGSQDQIWASYGGFNRINFYKNNKFNVKNINISNYKKKNLLNNFILVYTGISRLSDTIAGKIINNLKYKKENISEMINMVDEAEEILTNPKRNIDEIGELLDHYWKIKKKLSTGVTLDKIERIYKKAIKAGAIGGKLLGAGGGGFLLMYVNNKNKKNVYNELSNLIKINVSVDHLGSTIVDSNK